MELETTSAYENERSNAKVEAFEINKDTKQVGTLNNFHLYDNGQRVYTPENKPTPNDLGVYSKSEIPAVITKTITFSNPDVGYFRIASITIPQGAYTAFIRLYGGKGYNKGSHSQAAFYDLSIRAGNGNPKGITVTMFSPIAIPLGAFTDPCWVNTGGDNYDIYVKCGKYTERAAVQHGCTSGVNMVIHARALESATKPAEAVDGQYVKLFNDMDKRGTLYFDDNTQAQYDIVNLSNAPDSTAKKYLRKFRNYSAGTIWHETVTSSAYTIATGSTDSNAVFVVGSDAIVHTGGLQLRSTARINGKLTLGSGVDVTGRIATKEKVNQFQGVNGSGDLNAQYSTEAGVWGYTSNIGKDSTQNMFPTVNNANGVLTFNTHHGDFGHQIGLSSNGKLYHRHWKSADWRELVTAQHGNISGTTLSATGGIAGGSLSVSGSATIGAMAVNKLTVNSDADIKGTYLSVMNAGRRHIRFLKPDGGADFYIFKDVGGDGVYLNTGVDGIGIGEYIFKNDGDFHAPRNGNFNDVYIRSDGRLKINRKRVANALEKISHLDVCTYDKLKKLGSEEVVGREIGIIAQSLQKVAPEAVTEQADSMLTISNSGVNALLVKGMQELMEQNAMLLKRIEQLEQKQ